MLVARGMHFQTHSCLAPKRMAFCRCSFNIRPLGKKNIHGRNPSTLGMIERLQMRNIQTLRPYIISYIYNTVDGRHPALPRFYKTL